MDAIAASLIETLRGTATTPARIMPNSVSNVSTLLPIKPAPRSRGRTPKTARPFATRAVSAANSRHDSVAVPSMSAGRSASQRPFCAIRSGKRGVGAWNHDMFGSQQAAPDRCRAEGSASRAAAAHLEVVDHRPGKGARGSVEADLAHAANVGIRRCDRWRAEVVAGDAVVSVGQVLGVD